MNKAAGFFVVCAVAGAGWPVLAEVNSYGGYDIVAFAGAESFYASARNWNVFSANASTRHAYCFAEAVRSDGTAHRIGYDGAQWQLAVPVTASPDWQGVLQIDGVGAGQGYLRGGQDVSGTAVGGWTIAWLGLAELDGLKQGKTAVLGVGRGDYDFPLTGSTAAILKVEECVARAGIAPPAGTVQTPAEPSEITSVVFADAGFWAINELRAANRLLACEVFNANYPDMRIEIDRDNSHIDFRDGSGARNPGQRVGVNLSFGPGNGPFPYSAEIIEGRDGDAWMRITEGRADGPGLLDDWFQNAAQVTVQADGLLLEADLSGSKLALDAFFKCSNGLQ